VASVSGNLITALSSGSVAIFANQAGNASFNLADTKTLSLTVENTVLPQTITGYSSIPNLNVGNTYTITGVAGGGSGNPIVFTSSNPAIATVSGNVITALAAGNVTITASQAGNTAYAPAIEISQNLTVNVVLSVENPLSNETQISLYPNPAKEVMFIKILATGLPNKISIDLFNNVGQLVKRFNEIPISNKQLELDISNLPDGFYMLNFKIGNFNFTKKILKSI
jgi:hypothetical protein